MKENQKYCFIVDTYFDDSVLFENYLKYVSSYKQFSEYNKVNEAEHSENHYRITAQNMKKRWELSDELEYISISYYGSLREAINQGMFHPL